MNTGKLMVFVFLVIFSANVFAQKDTKLTEVKIKTSAMCDMCKEKIEKAVSKEAGVKSVSFDIKTKVLTVKFFSDKTDADKLKASINKVGYDADDKKADSKAYEKLPACCKKG